MSRKRMLVFTEHSDRHSAPPVVLFVEEPFDFASAHERSVTFGLGDGVQLPLVGLEEDLITMKREAGRAKDLEDFRLLQEIGGGES